MEVKWKALIVGLAIQVSGCSSQPKLNKKTTIRIDSADAVKQQPEKLSPNKESEIISSKEVIVADTKKARPDKKQAQVIRNPVDSKDLDPIVDTSIMIERMEKSTKEQFNPGIKVSPNLANASQIGEGYGDSISGAPASGIEGIFSCPTTDLPVYTGTINSAPSTSSMSEKYQNFCAGCHGAEGQGQGLYPSLLGLDQSQFFSVVRSGKDKMPAYSVAELSDQELGEIYSQLQMKMGPRPKTGTSPYTWNEATYQKVMDEGLAAWRKPDKDGVACANCHAPDAIDLAVIGYPDASILRRAHEHLSSEDAAAVVRYIHGQRRNFNIKRTCSPLWRPFQPGGVPLAGETPKEQDLEFEKVLEKRIPLLMLGKVVTLADAKSAFAELQEIDLRTLPIGIKLPRWTEDGFHGENHRSINDYLPPLGSIPNDKDKSYALEDSYIANGSDQMLYQLIADLEDRNDGGYAARTAKGATGNCFTYSEPGSFLTRMNNMKRESVLVAQHLFRKEVMQPGSVLSAPIPFLDSPKPMNPFLSFGGVYVEPPCYDDRSHTDLFETLTDSVRKELPRRDLEIGQAYWFHKDITHPWMTLGQVVGQSMLNSDTTNNNKLQYWSDLNFSQEYYHEPFFYAHRIARHEKDKGLLLSEISRNPGKKLSRYAVPNMSPLLHGETLFQMRVNNAVDPAEGEVFRSNRFRGNLIRTFLLLQKELLQNGSGVSAYGDSNCDHGLCLQYQYDKVQSFTKDLRFYLDKNEANQIDSSLVKDKELYTSDIDRLASEVFGMARNR